jgi:two-component system sensor histidine kinase SenX3
MWFAVVVAAVAGVALGIGIGARLLPRSGAVGRVAPSEADAPDAAAKAGHRAQHDDINVALRDAVNHLEIGVVLSDSDGVVYRNRAADVMIGTHVGVIVDEHVENMLAIARAGNRSERVVDLHGPPLMSLSIIVEPAPGGAAVAIIQDVSERVRIDAMRTDFVANISHELRTPVGALAVLAEALADESLDRRSRRLDEGKQGDDASGEMVARIAPRMVEESHRAVRTIDHLLELSRIESARPGEEVVDVSEVLDEALTRGRVVAGGRGVEVSAFDLGAPLHVRGDRRQLVSALGNLVENAVKYSPDGGVVQLRTRVDDQYVELMVADQGVGIPPRDLDRIFERFYRVDKGRSRETGGTGLGLAIVRHVASNHGGDVQVSSREGEGSTFVLRLPANLIVDEPIADEARTDADVSGRTEAAKQRSSNGE